MTLDVISAILRANVEAQVKGLEALSKTLQENKELAEGWAIRALIPLFWPFGLDQYGILAAGIRLDDAFAQRVKALGEVHMINVLISFGADLLTHVEGFDIDRINMNLNDYPNLIDSVKTYYPKIERSGPYETK